MDCSDIRPLPLATYRPEIITKAVFLRVQAHDSHAIKPYLRRKDAQMVQKIILSLCVCGKSLEPAPEANLQRSTIPPRLASRRVAERLDRLFTYKRCQGGRSSSDSARSSSEARSAGRAPADVSRFARPEGDWIRVELF